MFRVYIPTNVEWGDTLHMTMRLVVKITTPVKLNLKNKENQLLIDEDDET